MKILHLIYDDLNNPWVGGGGAVRTHEVNKRLAERHKITVLTGNFPNAKSIIKRDGVTYRRIGIDISYLLSRFTYCLKAPEYIKNGDFELIVDDFSSHSPILAPFYTNKPVVLLLQNLFGVHSIRKHKLFGVASYSIENIGLRCYKNVIAVSSSMKSLLQQRLSRNAKIRVINYAPDNSLFSLKPSENPFILFLGRLEIYQKGLGVLLKAFALFTKKYPSIKLKIAGRGREKEEYAIQELIRSLGLDDRVELVGFVKGQKKERILSSCLFLCMPSRYEGWGITAIEAAACQKPVIGTDIPGLSDVIRNGKTGLLVPPDDPILLSKAMIHLIENKETRLSLGLAAREWACLFTWDIVAQKQEDFYLKVVR